MSAAGEDVDMLADAVASLDYYLEAVRERRPGRARILEVARGRLANVLAWQSEIGVPVLPISCGEDEMGQVRRLLGRAPRGGTGR